MQNPNERPLVEGTENEYQSPEFLDMYDKKIQAMIKKGKNIPFTAREIKLLPRRGFVRTGVFQTGSFDNKGSRFIPRHYHPGYNWGHTYTPPETNSTAESKPEE